jgi:putative endopeptidase
MFVPLAFAMAQSGNPSAPKIKASSSQVPVATAMKGLDINAIDRSVDPCVDFYQYACGTWMKNNPIPPDQSVWGRFNELQERNLVILRGILEKAAAPNPNRTPVEQKIGDFYSSCMDERAIDRKGIAPIRADLDRIAALKDKAALVGEVAALHREGVNVLFSFGSGADFKDSNMTIAQADQGGLGLPDRDYYLKTDAKSVELRKQYEAHVAKMFELIGDSPAEAARKAAVVLRIETGLAEGALDRVSRRDPAKVYHKMTAVEFESLTPAFGFKNYLAGMGTPQVGSLNVAEPGFFKQLQALITKTSLADWKTYLAWHVVHSNAALLPQPFVNADFDFYGRTLTGAKELKPRWKRCVAYTDNDLGEALGQKYVELTFGKEGKERTLKMVNQIEQALGRDIQQLPWMTAETKKKALEKLHEVTNKIGYPDKWRDYSTVKIVRDDFIGNDRRATEFEVHRQLAKIGTAPDRKEWGMTPPTVNAYYDPTMNNINFPAGILQPPFYDSQRDDAVNLGGIGAVIGHELTHGFDDEGRQFDGQGNLRDWWTPADTKEFARRSKCLVDEYSSFVSTGDTHLNGELTLGENTADNGGVRLALMVLESELAGKTPAKVDGFTPEQRLFLGYAQIWCQNATPEALRLRAQTDPHSPGRFRVNGVVQNMPEFQSAFACKAGQPMVRQPACRVW